MMMAQRENRSQIWDRENRQEIYHIYIYGIRAAESCAQTSARSIYIIIIIIDRTNTGNIVTCP